MAGVNRHDARRSRAGARAEVRRLAVVGVNAEVLEPDRGPEELVRVRGRVAEVELGLAGGVGAEERQQGLHVRALVAGGDAGELGQVALQRPAVDRPGVERRLETLQPEREVQDVGIRAAGLRRPGARRQGGEGEPAEQHHRAAGGRAAQDLGPRRA